MDPVDVVQARGGFASTAQLRVACGPARLTTLVRAGRLSRPRVGWYSTVRSDDPRYRAVAVGGRLTGVSALHAMGAWMLRPPTALHVAVPRNASRLRTRDDDGLVLHWAPEREPASTPAIVGLRDALLRVALDESLEVSVPCFDWALASGRLDAFDYEQVLRKLPRSSHVLRDWIDPRSQSVLESVARVRLLARGWRVRSQVRVGDLQSIDLVVEDHVALELDGRTFHESRFESDRAKDLAIAIEGRHAIRVTARMVYRDWSDVEHAIEAALFARDRRNSGNHVARPHGRKVGPHETGRFA